MKKLLLSFVLLSLFIISTTQKVYASVDETYPVSGDACINFKFENISFPYPRFDFIENGSGYNNFVSTQMNPSGLLANQLNTLTSTNTPLGSIPVGPGGNPSPIIQLCQQNDQLLYYKNGQLQGTLNYSASVPLNNVRVVYESGISDLEIVEGFAVVIPPNDAPQVSTLDDANLYTLDQYTDSGNFTDADYSTSWTATVDYGDGTGVLPLTLNNKNFNLNHNYENGGTFTVTVSVTDTQGLVGTSQATITVEDIDFMVSSLSSSRHHDADHPVLHVSNFIEDAEGASCSLIDNATSTSVDNAATLNSAEGYYGIRLSLDWGEYPVGWSESKEYHATCVKSDSSTIISNSFKFFAAPTIVDSVQNENLIDVYFDDPHNTIFSDGTLHASSGWFDDLGYGQCESDVMHESNILDVCHFDLLVNPQLPSNNAVILVTGGRLATVDYGMESTNVISVLGLSPNVQMVTEDAGTTGTTYTQNGSFTDNFSSSWNATVDYGDGEGNQPLLLSGNNFEVSHNYNTPGSYYISVNVYDDDGMIGNSGTLVTIAQGNTAPEVDAQGPYEVNVGNTVQVTAVGTDPEEDTLTYTWDLDNNGSFESTGQEVTFDATSLTTGSYTIKVRTTDPGELTDTDEATVTVNSNVQTMTIDPGADSYVDQDHPNQNYGNENMLFSDNNPKKISYMKFNLASLAGKTIVSASLKLKVNDPSNVVQSLRLADMTNWTENGLDYNNRPLFDSTITTFTPNVNEGVYNLDVASAVDTRKGDKMTLGVSTSTGTDRVKFYSKDAGNAANRPQLTVEYTE